MEGELVKWSFVAQVVPHVHRTYMSSHIIQSDRVPWCYRMQLAQQVVDILRLLDSRHLVHCDWKYDQASCVSLKPHLNRIDVVAIDSWRSHLMAL